MLASLRGKALAATTRASKSRRVPSRPSSSAAAEDSAAPRLVTLSVNHAELYEAKLARVGKALENFKAEFEAPVKDLFLQNQTKNAKEYRRMMEQIKKRMKTHRLKMKDIMAKKEKVAGEKMLIQMQEEIAHDMTQDPYTMEEFVLGARPPPNVDQVLDGLVKKLRDSFQIMPDERERELEHSDYWLEPSYLRAANPLPSIKMLETTRIRWELALQPSELAKWVARELKEKFQIAYDEDHPLLTSRDAILGPSKISSTLQPHASIFCFTFFSCVLSLQSVPFDLRSAKALDCNGTENKRRSKRILLPEKSPTNTQGAHVERASKA